MTAWFTAARDSIARVLAAANPSSRGAAAVDGGHARVGRAHRARRLAAAAADRAPAAPPPRQHAADGRGLAPLARRPAAPARPHVSPRAPPLPAGAEPPHGRALAAPAAVPLRGPGRAGLALGRVA